MSASWEDFQLPDPELDESFAAAMAGIKFLDLEEDLPIVTTPPMGPTSTPPTPPTPPTPLPPALKKVWESRASLGSVSTVESVGALNSPSMGSTTPLLTYQDQKDWEDANADEEVRTTLMIRNIPRKYTQRQLLADLNEAHAFMDSVNFFYLPADLGTGRNLGYCFINFIRPADAVRVKQQLHKLRLFPGVKSGLSIGYADVQSLESNLRNVRRSLMHRIKNREYRPLVAAPGGELMPVSS
jgi:hypothetical protein